MTPPNLPAVEFSRPVSTTRLGVDAMVYQIAANAAERAALARRFDLVSLDHLAATVRLTRQGHDVCLAAALSADVVQLCGVTLEPFPSRVVDHSTLHYRRQAPPGDLAVEDEIYEILTGDTIDIGEAVAQQLSLALPPFPRAPDAAIPAAENPACVEWTADPSVGANPFDELAKLAKK
jgi:uncharacterized metal-binding protein YceD (DUF177 family)